MIEQSSCSVTHPQIVRGPCPHCKLQVTPDPAAPGATAEAPDVTWNVARMLKDLERDDEATRLTTIWNLSDHLPPLHEALPIVRKAFRDRARRVRDRAVTAAARLGFVTEGRTLVETCESLLRDDPADMAALQLLLDHYARGDGGLPSDRERWSAHVLRVIEEMPDAPDSLQLSMATLARRDPEVFERAQALWRAQVDAHPDNPRILGNAAIFFLVDDDTMAGMLLRRCKELEPGDPRWSFLLGTLYSHQRVPGSPEGARDWGLMSLAELEHAWSIATDADRRYGPLMRIPAVALQAGEMEKARDYAERLLAAASEQPHPGMQVAGDREANAVLGWYALSTGDFDDARRRLFSARPPAAAYFHSCYCFMDPLMKLVAWMLYRDQGGVVLQYMRRDQQVVPEFRDRLERWAGEIERGLTPDFQDRALLAENFNIVKATRTKAW